MSKSYAVLPCNGLDKCAGCVSREVAVILSEKTGSEVICPVFYRESDARYNKLLQDMPLLVIDGCATRCASKLAAEKNIKIAEKINVTDEAKASNMTIGKGLRIGENELRLAEMIVEKLTAAKQEPITAYEHVDFPKTLVYESYKKDKFTFRLPNNAGFYFNENDVWAYVAGNKARIGVTDYVQINLSDIMFFTPVSVGSKIEQFGEAGTIESGKASFEIVAPFGGVITAVNERLNEEPELINQNPYEQGWIAEMELSDFDGDRELLHDFNGYFPLLKKKADDYHA